MKMHKYILPLFIIMVLAMSSNAAEQAQTAAQDEKAVQVETAPAGEAAAVQPAQAEKTGKAEQNEAAPFQPALGTWRQLIAPGVVCELTIEAISPDGLVKATYKNDLGELINISETDAKIRDGKVNLFIKFKDRYYPGSFFKLVCNEREQVLKGDFFKALDGITYPAVFTRPQENKENPKTPPENPQPGQAAS